MSWRYAIDPAFREAADVPGWGVMGAYPLDEQGEIAGEFVPNPDYQPSPISLGLPAPVNELEAALHLAATGYGSQEALAEALLAAELLVPVWPTGEVVVVADGDRPMVPAYTSEAYLPPDVPGWRGLRAGELPLDGRDLALNPGSAVAVRLPGEALHNQ